MSKHFFLKGICSPTSLDVSWSRAGSFNLLTNFNLITDLHIYCEKISTCVTYKCQSKDTGRNILYIIVRQMSLNFGSDTY